MFLQGTTTNSLALKLTWGRTIHLLCCWGPRGVNQCLSHRPRRSHSTEVLTIATSRIPWDYFNYKLKAFFFFLSSMLLWILRNLRTFPKLGSFRKGYWTGSPAQADKLYRTWASVAGVRYRSLPPAALQVYLCVINCQVTCTRVEFSAFLWHPTRLYPLEDRVFPVCQACLVVWRRSSIVLPVVSQRGVGLL